MTKTCVDGKRPGDTFHHQGEAYRVIAIVRAYRELRVVTESVHGCEIWV